MRRNLTALAAVGLLGVAACEADRETFEETDATLAPPPAVEAARENPIDPTGAALGDQTGQDTMQGVAVPADTAH